MRKRETPEADPATPAQDAPRGRRKWVTHGLSNRVVYGGLHYGARWLPLPVLHGISLFGNSLAVTFMRETLEGIRENYRLALGVPEREARRLARRLFRVRPVGDRRLAAPERSLRPEDHVLRCGCRPARRRPEERPRLPARDRARRQLGDGPVTLRGHALTPAVVGQPELDPDVEAMRLSLRTRLGVESIDIGSSMATAFRVRSAVEAKRAVALLVDRAYPEDQVVVPYFGRPTPFSARRPSSPVSASARSFPDSSFAAPTAPTSTSGALRSAWTKRSRPRRMRTAS